MKAWSRVVLSGLFLLLCTGSATAGTLKLEIRGGLVTLEARDVPIRDILAEWARVGQTRIENREQVGGAPVTLTLRNVPEREALDILLRSVTGYIAAPRSTPVADASVYEVIYVLAAARPATRTATGSVQSQPQLIRSGPGQTPGLVIARPAQPQDDLADDAVPPVMPGFSVQQVPPSSGGGSFQVPGQMSGALVTAPGMAVPQATSANPYVSAPGMSTGQDGKTVGTATPGMPTPSPPQPYVPGGGVAPPSPIKPPGTPDTPPASPVIQPPGAP